MHNIGFKNELTEKILKKEKTITRRPVRPEHNDVCPYGPAGKVLYIRYTNHRILITSVEREPLQAIPDSHIEAEGCESREQFLKIWDKIYKKMGFPSENNPDVWVIGFKLTDLPYQKVQNGERKKAEISERIPLPHC